MYSVLGRGSFCLNYCLNSAWHGGDQFVALLRWYGSPGFFDSGLAFIWKEDFGPLGNSPVLLLLSPGKTPLTTTVAKFLDTSVCGALDALTPASVHSLWSSPKFLNRFCLTILIRTRFSRLVVHLFLPHFFLPLNFLLTCLDTVLCEQLLWQWMFVVYPPCEGCQWLSSGQLSAQQSSPWLCSLVNQTETILKAQETFAGVLSWLAGWHVTIFWFVEIGVFLLNVSQNHHN